MGYNRSGDRRKQKRRRHTREQRRLLRKAETTKPAGSTAEKAAEASK
jgi:hypothetical protein